MSFTKPTNISIPELREITRLYKLKGDRKVTQTEIKNRIDSARKDAGTYVGQGISTNTVWKLNPKLKGVSATKRTKTITTAVSAWGEWDVAHMISKCLHCSVEKGRDIYFEHVLPISPQDFYDPNNRYMVAIRFGVPESCDAPIYFVISTIGYETWVNGDDDDDDEDIPTSDTGVKEVPDLWTFRTPFTYKDVLSGSLPLSEVLSYIDSVVKGEYEYEFVNTVINVER